MLSLTNTLYTRESFYLRATVAESLAPVNMWSFWPLREMNFPVCSLVPKSKGQISIKQHVLLNIETELSQIFFPGKELDKFSYSFKNTKISQVLCFILTFTYISIFLTLHHVLLRKLFQNNNNNKLILLYNIIKCIGHFYNKE